MFYPNSFSAATLLVLLILTALQPGCSLSFKQTFLRQNYADREVNVPVHIDNLQFEDLRTTVTDRSLRIPFMSFPGQHDEVNPILTDAHKLLIGREISRHLQKDGKPVSALVQISKGLKRFNASMFYEKEYVAFTVAITLTDGLHRPYLVKSQGEAFYQVRSVDASDEYTEDLYQKAIKAAVFKCLSNMSDYLVPSAQPSDTIRSQNEI